EVEPTLGSRLQMEAPGEPGGRACESRGDADRPRVQEARDHPRVEHGLRRHVEGAVHVALDGEAVGLADVERVHRLEPQPRDLGHDRNPAGEEAWKQAAREESALLLAGLALEDHPWTQPDRADGRMLALEPVQEELALCLVPRVEARGDASRRPALVDAAVLRSRRVCADGW